MTLANEHKKEDATLTTPTPVRSTPADLLWKTKPRARQQKPIRQLCKRAFLWTNLCISTGLNVRNRVNLTLSISYPVYVRPRYRACAAACKPRKPLSMWTKNRLSTNFQPFTITTTFIYLSKLTKRAKQAQSGARPSSLSARLFLSTEQMKTPSLKKIAPQHGAGKTKPVSHQNGRNALFVSERLVAHVNGLRRNQRFLNLLPSRCKRTSSSKTPQNHVRCGKLSAYPQRRMCKSRVFLLKTNLVQHRCRIDTRVLQRFQSHVSH